MGSDFGVLSWKCLVLIPQSHSPPTMLSPATNTILSHTPDFVSNLVEPTFLFSGTNFIQIIKILSDLCTGIVSHSIQHLYWFLCGQGGKQLQATFSRRTQEKRREDQGTCSNRMLGLCLTDVIARESLSSVPSQLLILAENLYVHICW